MVPFEIVPGVVHVVSFDSQDKCPLCYRELGTNPEMRYVKTPGGGTIAAHKACADEEETLQGNW